MGFNNGYDSGYSDCEAENRKRWEREAVERYKAENPPSGGSSGGTRSAKVFKLASTNVSPTVVYNADDDSYDIQITLSPPTGMDDVDGVDGTWSTTGSGTIAPKLYWTPSEPAGDWVVGDVVIVGSISANYAGGYFQFGLGGLDNTWMDDTSNWDTNNNMDPAKNTSVMIYLGNNRWKFGVLVTNPY